MSSNIIAILTDFGVEEHYNGVMKGVILAINKNANIVDLVPAARAFSIEDASFQLWASYKYFPKGTVFLVVVDPGVGGERQPIAIKTNNYFFVGPDNGVLYPAAAEDGIIEVYKITSDKVILKDRTGTFDGRDIFAPAAAYISRGESLSFLGEQTELKVKLEFGSPEILQDGLKAKVLHVDRFGDVVTNIKKDLFERLKCNSYSIKNHRLSFAKNFESCQGLCLVLGSSGFYEIVAFKQKAADKLKVSTGQTIKIKCRK